MRQAGFSGIVEEDRRPVRNAPADGAFWQANMMMSCGPHLRDRDPATLKCLDQAIRAGFEAYRDGGSYRLPVQDRKKHTSELQSLMRISYAVFCLKNNNQ